MVLVSMIKGKITLVNRVDYDIEKRPSGFPNSLIFQS